MDRLFGNDFCILFHKKPKTQLHFQFTEEENKECMR